MGKMGYVVSLEADTGIREMVARIPCIQRTSARAGLLRGTRDAAVYFRSAVNVPLGWCSVICAMAPSSV